MAEKNKKTQTEGHADRMLLGRRALTRRLSFALIPSKSLCLLRFFLPTLDRIGGGGYNKANRAIRHPIPIVQETPCPLPFPAPNCFSGTTP